MSCHHSPPNSASRKPQEGLSVGGVCRAEVKTGDGQDGRGVLHLGHAHGCRVAAQVERRMALEFEAERRQER